MEPLIHARQSRFRRGELPRAVGHDVRCDMRGVVLLVVMVPSTAAADWPEANPGRPSFSDNAATTATGAFEIEAGVATADLGDTGSAQWTLKYGVTDRFDVRLNLETTVWGSDLALAGSSLLLKLTLRPPDEDVLGIALEPYLSFPVPDGPDSWGAGIGLVGTYVTRGFQIDANAVVDVATADMQDTAATITPIVAIGHDVVGDLAAYVEGLAELPVAGGGSASPFVGVGVGYALTKFLVLDAAFYLGDEPRTQIFAGLTYSMYIPPRHRPSTREARR